MEEKDLTLAYEKLKKEVKDSKLELWKYTKFIFYPLLVLFLIAISDKENFSLKSLAFIVVCMAMWIGDEIRKLILKQ